jgi:Tfp pilus assembly protein PilO
MDLNDPKVAKLLFLGLFFAGFLYLYFGTALLPFTHKAQAGELQELSERYEELSLEVNRARQTVKHLPHLEAEYEALEQKWSEANQLLPEQKQVTSLLREISFRGQICGVEFTLFEPQAPVPAEFYTENPVSAKVEGGYHNIAAFLNELARMTRIVNVRNLKVEEVTSNEKSKWPAKAEFTIVAYTLGVDPSLIPASDEAKNQRGGSRTAPSHGRSQE